ncbi:MAG: c-type cytochrome [Gammaproteobacteria bacterium]|nr:c-type cytochrome [Gammaproteobacteria bacterium]
MLKQSAKIIFLLGLFFGTVVPGRAETPQSEEVRPDLVKPQLSLPSNLIKVPAVNPGEYFIPPYVADIPEDKYGDIVEWGRKIFSNTQIYGKRYTGNGLNCTSCHLSEGRQPNAAPLWAAYPKYPMYRKKTRNVVTFEERIQDCFKYSMDGIAPTVDAPEMEALVTYAHWLSTGAPVNTDLPGGGFFHVGKPEDAQAGRGKDLYDVQCAFCHGLNGKGQKHTKHKGYMFPPLWGQDSFNRAAGLSNAKTMAQFIYANMPLGASFSLGEQDAWDIAMYIWLQDRPFDPRKSVFSSLFIPVTPGQNY